MKTIVANSLPIKDTICDIAKALSTTCEENGEEYTLKLPSSVGTGFITGLVTDSGMAIIVYECVFKEDVNIQFSINRVNPLKFLYVLSGSLVHYFENSSTPSITVNQYQSFIVASEEKNGHILCFKANTRTRMHCVEIDRKKFLSKMHKDMGGLHPDLQALFEDVKGTNAFYHLDHYSLELFDLFEQMYIYKESDFLRKLYLEGMAYLAVIKQMALYVEDKSMVSEKHLLRITEIEKVKQAVTLIEANISDTPNIPEIAHDVGLTTVKLQYGVKLLYRCTVNEYIMKTKIKEARVLILNTDYNMGEIAMKIGINSNSHFSKIFKEHYGISPSVLREKHMASVTKGK